MVVTEALKAHEVPSAGLRKSEWAGCQPNPVIASLKGVAIQSRQPRRVHGLPRRCAPRNDEGTRCDETAKQSHNVMRLVVRA